MKSITTHIGLKLYLHSFDEGKATGRKNKYTVRYNNVCFILYES